MMAPCQPAPNDRAVVIGGRHDGTECQVSPASIEVGCLTFQEIEDGTEWLYGYVNDGEIDELGRIVFRPPPPAAAQVAS